MCALFRLALSDNFSTKRATPGRALAFTGNFSPFLPAIALPGLPHAFGFLVAKVADNALEVVAWMDPVHLSTSPGKLRWQPSLPNAPTLYFNFTPNIIPWSPITHPPRGDIKTEICDSFSSNAFTN